MCSLIALPKVILLEKGFEKFLTIHDHAMPIGAQLYALKVSKSAKKFN